ncbi:hypothetical protein CC78DRAFT_582855 [Lojkania enalia]|uniref:Uncharacterized protein n=1 Tax=Lojkania enalia TaxID=147567 RepID=A0A9P4N7I1_9PLEO|nr:hypothetical protein CC78DRAFT_582855 [Didymosphaeria enalia]
MEVAFTFGDSLLGILKSTSGQAHDSGKCLFQNERAAWTGPGRYLDNHRNTPPKPLAQRLRGTRIRMQEDLRRPRARTQTSFAKTPTTQRAFCNEKLGPPLPGARSGINLGGLARLALAPRSRVDSISLGQLPLSASGGRRRFRLSHRLPLVDIRRANAHRVKGRPAVRNSTSCFSARSSAAVHRNGQMATLIRRHQFPVSTWACVLLSAPLYFEKNSTVEYTASAKPGRRDGMGSNNPSTHGPPIV